VNGYDGDDDDVSNKAFCNNVNGDDLDNSGDDDDPHQQIL
jgi:hypothetical protein